MPDIDLDQEKRDALAHVVAYLRDNGVDVAVPQRAPGYGATHVLANGVTVDATVTGKSWTSRPPRAAIEVAGRGALRTQAYRVNAPGWEARVLAQAADGRGVYFSEGVPRPSAAEGAGGAPTVLVRIEAPSRFGCARPGGRGRGTPTASRSSCWCSSATTGSMAAR